MRIDLENIRTKVERLRISDGGQRVRAAWGLGAQGGAERPWERGQGSPGAGVWLWSWDTGVWASASVG